MLCTDLKLMAEVECMGLTIFSTEIQNVITDTSAFDGCHKSGSTLVFVCHHWPTKNSVSLSVAIVASINSNFHSTLNASMANVLTTIDLNVEYYARFNAQTTWFIHVQNDKEDNKKVDRISGDQTRMQFELFLPLNLSLFLSLSDSIAGLVWSELLIHGRQRRRHQHNGKKERKSERQFYRCSQSVFAIHYFLFHFFSSSFPHHLNESDSRVLCNRRQIK